jgi:hypothetical protein
LRVIGGNGNPVSHAESWGEIPQATSPSRCLHHRLLASLLVHQRLIEMLAGRVSCLSPQSSLNRRSSMSVSPEAAKSAIRSRQEAPVSGMT